MNFSEALKLLKEGKAMYVPQDVSKIGTYFVKLIGREFVWHWKGKSEDKDITGCGFGINSQKILAEDWAVME